MGDRAEQMTSEQWFEIAASLAKIPELEAERDALREQVTVRDAILAEVFEAIPGYPNGSILVEGWRAALGVGEETTTAPVCSCTSEGCDAEGEPGCAYCRTADPELPCPAEPSQETRT